MKKVFLPLLAALTMLTSCGIVQNLDPTYLASAASNALTALTLSDAQVNALSQQTVVYMDQQYQVDNGQYLDRLKRVMAGINNVEGIPLSFKVYHTNEVNAFACGDGSIRVYTGLMDTMDDDELLAIIGHEIGHVVHRDTKKSMQKAYMASAARDVLSSAGGTVGTLSSSVLGDLAESYVSAQFSQKQEYAADEYGFAFTVEHDRNPYSMYNALSKLVSLSQSSKSSQVQKMFASHPDSESRAAKVKEMADAYIFAHKPAAVQAEENVGRTEYLEPTK